jgi:uncharacterized membrane protein YeiB
VWMVFLKTYWRLVLELVFFLSLLVLLGLMKISNTRLEADKKVLESELSSIALQLEQNAKDYDVAMTEYTKNIQHRDKVFKTRVESIYIWEDKNASCENAINRFDNYTF